MVCYIDVIIDDCIIIHVCDGYSFSCNSVSYGGFCGCCLMRMRKVLLRNEEMARKGLDRKTSGNSEGMRRMKKFRVD